MSLRAKDMLSSVGDDDAGEQLKDRSNLVNEREVRRRAANDSWLGKSATLQYLVRDGSEELACCLG